MSALAPINDIQNIEALLVSGDLSKLSASDRLAYYRRRCELLDLDPLSAPFAYLQLSGKLTLYATKGATEQIAAKRGISLEVIQRERADGVYIVTCRAIEPNGRHTDSTGVTAVEGVKGEALCNAIMKAETKAKRRAVLSLCGLGMMDETEIDSVADAHRVSVDYRTGEIIEAPNPTPPPPLHSSKPTNTPIKTAFAKAIKDAGLPLNSETFNKIFSTQIAEGGVKEFMSARTDAEVTTLHEVFEEWLNAQKAVLIEVQGTPAPSQTVEAIVV
jgi:hypothetical protein